MNLTDAVRRAIRTLAVFIASSAVAVPSIAVVFGIPAGRVAQVVAALTALGTVLTGVLNSLEDKGTIPALLKAPPSPGADPIPDNAGPVK